MYVSLYNVYYLSVASFLKSAGCITEKERIINTSI